MGMGQGVRAGLGYGGITCVVQTQFSSSFSIFQLHRAPNTIKTGSKAIDNHCMKSTMSGEIGEMVNGFRQKRLEEYFEIQELCDLSGVALSRTLLEKGINCEFLESSAFLSLGKNFFPSFIFAIYRVAGYFCRCLISVYFCSFVKNAEMKI